MEIIELKNIIGQYQSVIFNNMKRIIIFPLLMITPLIMLAQFFQTSNQQMIKDAIYGGLIVIEQSYQLEDTTTHQRFGRYGNAEFGKSYSLAVKLKDGLCVTDNAVHPWAYDENYARYRESYKPVLYKTRYRELSDSLMCDILLMSDIPECLGGSHLYFVRDSIMLQGKGFQTDCSKGKRDGWIVWVTSTIGMELCDSAVTSNYTIYKQEFELTSNSIEYAVNPPQTDKQIWGGIYVVPVQNGVGQLLFKLVGVLIKKEDGWMMTLPEIPERFTNRENVESREGMELTPVGKEKKGKENKKKNKGR